MNEHKCDHTCQPPHLPNQADIAYWVHIAQLTPKQSFNLLYQAANQFCQWMNEHPDKKHVAQQYIDDQAIELEVALDLRKIENQ